VGAVAPRIGTPPGDGAIAAYEAVRSPLDLGCSPGIVAPGRRLGFVPSTALLVRREALDGGFDRTLRYGEDVDLVWHLVAAGWTVRYDPSAVVVHPHRGSTRAWLAQRVAYGSSAGPLDARHPGQLRHVVAPAWAVVSSALALAGRPRAALGTAVVAGGSVAARLPGPRGPIAGVTVLVQLRVARALVDCSLRAYAPLLLAGAVASRRVRRFGAAGLAASVLIDWGERRPRLDPLRYGALRAADDLAYATGLWLGCVRARRAGPLVPKLVGGRPLTSSSRRTGRR
jgi:mycofactocin system glycosyltransferase